MCAFSRSDCYAGASLPPIIFSMEINGYHLQVYDTVLNLADEVKLIWFQRWSVGKMLYLTTRYSAIFDGGVLLYCQYIVFCRPFETCLSLTSLHDSLCIDLFYEGTVDVSLLHC